MFSDMGLGVISQAKGSAYVEIGQTKVVCGIYGPKEVHRISDIKLSGQVWNYICTIMYRMLYTAV